MDRFSASLAWIHFAVIAAATLMAVGPANASWRFSDSKSPMGEGTTTFACTTSTNKISQRLPYHDVSADLCVRYKPDPSKHDWKRYDVIVMLLGDGQIICGVGGCDVPVRFDDKKPKTWNAIKPADYSSNKLFFDMHWLFANEIDKSKKAAIELTLYQNGTQALDFDTSGLHLSDLPRGQK